MISNKHFNAIVAILMVIAICFSSLIVLLPKNITLATSITQPNYVTTIFDDDKVIEINIEMSEDDWQEMIDNASAEEYTSANITVNGTTYTNVGIRPKGNSSLSQIVADSTTDRFSFKLKFDKYIDGQTLAGLSKLVLNNNMSDTTYMKEYLSYKLLDSLNVPTPECAYAHITVNGEEWGLYLAVEPIEEEFIERHYGSINGNLYKPESDSVAMGNKDDNGQMQTPPDMNNGDNSMQMQTPPDMNNGDTSMQMQTPPDMSNGDTSMQMQPPPDMNNGDNSMQMQTPPDMNNGDNSMQMQTPPDMNNGDNSMQMPQSMPNGIGGGMGGNSNGADLVWNGDDVSNYSSIFDNAIFKTTNSDDYTKILDMIEHLDSLEDIESYLNVDEVLRYFAVNTFLVNLDSYASNMKHNYYLYEDDGLVSILPWDYNLSFAGFQAGSASNAINFPIDSPVSDSLEASPLIGKLLEVDKYKELYHQYLNEIVENFINNGTYETLITKVNSLISNYVENDATAFYTFEEYTNSLTHLINFGYDRATSITAQLDGSQPSTSYGNIDTTVDLTALGQQGGGNDKGGMFNKDNQNGNLINNMSIDQSLMIQAIQIIQNSGDSPITDAVKEELLNIGLTDEQINEITSFQAQNNSGNKTQVINNNFAMGPKQNSTTNFETLILSFSSILILICSLVFVLLFKKRKYVS
ncbi:CotH kinase family protein [Clostridium celatum]|uniref:CotH kinase family protein n=1 Tax=Clostridium celatum TaxID=36834 RepID=UPI002902C973|nr:CotH kinase family protein [Clostridium celatum]MDU2266839.1 CotH kinase family protein [Clostridium celatum]MDU6297330.1 CotH kinase family protein [Clostridium celatum]